MEQYSVPQFIEAEAKINPFLTFRQFFILVGGGAICLGAYYALPFFLFLLCSAIVAFLVAIFGFLKIDGAPVAKILLNILSFSTKTKDYTWKKKEISQPFKLREPEHIKNMQELATADLKGLDGAKKIVELRKK